MKKNLYILFILLGFITLPSCEKETIVTTLDNSEPKVEVENGYANLTISMNVPSLKVESRTLASDPKNQGGSWTNWEKFVDGALLYRVTLFVIDSNNKLVAYRNFHSGSGDIKPETDAMGGNGFYETSAVNTSATTGVAVKATFNSANPMHGKIEKLQPGDYQIIAVANYAPITASDSGLFPEGETVTTYSGLGNVAEDDGNNNGLGGDFTNIVNTIISSFNPSSGLPDFSQTGTNGSSFFTYKLNSGTDRVCKQLPQPLVMIRKVTLQTDKKNEVRGLLSRTFARVRLEVKNNDKSTLIGVSNLSFQNNYASQNAYLFNDVAAGDNNLYNHFSLYGTVTDDGTVTDGTAGTLVVTSPDAITPASTDMKRLPAGVTNTMLDCYILEGKISAEFAFSFTATYWANAQGGTATANYRITSFYGGSGNDSYGLLEFFVYIRDSSGSSSNYILTSNTENIFSQEGTVTATTPGSVDLGETVLDPKYIWEISLNVEPTESNERGVATGYLQCIGSGLYLQAYDGSGDMTPKLGDEKSEVIFKINFRNQVENGTIYCIHDGKYYYLDSDSSHNLKWVEYGELSGGITTSTPSSYEYLAFETIPGNKGTQKDVEIKKAITNSSGTGTGTNEIVRNDFFYGIIPISISSTSVSN